MMTAPHGSSVLRPMNQADLEMVLSWRNHPEVRRHMYNQTEISLEEHSRWFAGAAKDTRRHLLVFEQAGRAAGFVNLLEDAPGQAYWGFYLAPDAARGTGRELGACAVAYAFEELALQRIWGEVLAENSVSQKFHERLGFVLEEVIAEKIVAGRTLNGVRKYVLGREAWKERQGSQT
ncbi:UDP-4-amino-4,6-dideoxy-N-acetyl-beta-L-altrosamine N-acetyltransferase [Herbaspirillum sp. NPDC087042]|uniref:UDP-4-amino-4, 6-dideoxy-N-acetyl-beta-L-altrosamine N-acetyltransferase n=1 Tax=Herbaspirillum sp. NPDC087042 TaxID=3364004 RepID=UPI0038183E39